jgi:hypothetical protein
MNEQQPKDQEFRQMLSMLHDELAKAHTLDEDERAMMRHLMNDIQELLNRDQPAAPVINRLEKSITELEVTHPTLTAAIKKVLDTLNVAGI